MQHIQQLEIILALASQAIIGIAFVWNASRQVAKFEAKLEQVRYELKQDINNLGHSTRRKLSNCGYQDRDVITVMTHIQGFLQAKYPNDYQAITMQFYSPEDDK